MNNHPNVLALSTVYPRAGSSNAGACLEIWKGGGRILKPSQQSRIGYSDEQKIKKSDRAHADVQFSRPKTSEEPRKKGHHARRCPIFRPKSSKKQKKNNVITPVGCPLRI